MATDSENSVQWHINRFWENWEVDVQNRLIRRKQTSYVQYFIELFQPPKFEVITIYRGMMNWGAAEQGIVWPTPVDRDRMQVEGHPEKFILKDGWKISTGDLKSLTGGPLIYDGAPKAIVPAHRDRLRIYWSTLTRPVWAAIYVMGAIITLVTFIQLF